VEFEWDERKNQENRLKHGVDFYAAQKPFLGPFRIITKDLLHSNESEDRYFCFGLIDDRILTVRFTIRMDKIRIFGAGFWREGKKFYEKENKL
jgi:uncharacterized DUF497 family protein